MRPTQREIAKILDDMSNIGAFDPDGFDDELWWVTCVDPMGQRRANGTGVTAIEAMAAAWVNTFLPPCQPGEEFQPIKDADRSAVPPVVPDDGTFEIDDFPASGAA